MNHLMTKILKLQYEACFLMFSIKLSHQNEGGDEESGESEQVDAKK